MDFDPGHHSSLPARVHIAGTTRAAVGLVSSWVTPTSNLTVGDGDTRRAAALFAAFPCSVERVQPYFTRKNEKRDGSIHTLSRINCVFINLPVAELSTFLCHSHTTVSSGDKICAQ